MPSRSHVLDAVRDKWADGVLPAVPAALSSTLASAAQMKGTHAIRLILSGLFATFGLPASGLTMLLGVDALIDMVRTSVNVVGHCVACPVIARWADQGATQEKLASEFVSPEPL